MNIFRHFTSLRHQDRVNYCLLEKVTILHFYNDCGIFTFTALWPLTITITSILVRIMPVIEDTRHLRPFMTAPKLKAVLKRRQIIGVHLLVANLYNAVLTKHLFIITKAIKLIELTFNISNWIRFPKNIWNGWVKNTRSALINKLAFIYKQAVNIAVDTDDLLWL